MCGNNTAFLLGKMASSLMVLAFIFLEDFIIAMLLKSVAVFVCGPILWDGLEFSPALLSWDVWG